MDSDAVALAAQRPPCDFFSAKNTLSTFSSLFHLKNADCRQITYNADYLIIKPTISQINARENRIFTQHPTSTHEFQSHNKATEFHSLFLDQSSIEHWDSNINHRPMVLWSNSIDPWFSGQLLSLSDILLILQIDEDIVAKYNAAAGRAAPRPADHYRMQHSAPLCHGGAPIANRLPA